MTARHIHVTYSHGIWANTKNSTARAIDNRPYIFYRYTCLANCNLPVSRMEWAQKSRAEARDFS